MVSAPHRSEPIHAINPPVLPNSLRLPGAGRLPRGRLRDDAIISLPGGDLRIQWPGGDAEIVMSGPTAFVFDGEWTA